MTTELQAAAAEIEHKNEPAAPSSDEVDTHINSLYNDALSSRDGYGNAHDDAKAIRAHIAALEAENKRLREALKSIDGIHDGPPMSDLDKIGVIRALSDNNILGIK